LFNRSDELPVSETSSVKMLTEADLVRMPLDAEAVGRPDVRAALDARGQGQGE
jgi:hypothetical protein